MKELVRKMLPDSFINLIRNYNKGKKTRFINEMNKRGFIFDKKSNYYSPLPDYELLMKNKERWNKPSELIGINWSLDELKNNFAELHNKYYHEVLELPTFIELENMGFGVGFTPFDSYLLYYMIREHKPKRYFEIGSGTSTYFCHLASQKNVSLGFNATEINCIEPYPWDLLKTIQPINLTVSEVQSVPFDYFNRIEDGDFLFIDSTHIVKLDGDVPYLFLEILPRINKNIFIHIHDIAFPYTIPYPSDFWISDRKYETEDQLKIPMYWTEGMLLQALLTNNPLYSIHQSMPMIRYYDNEYLTSLVPETSKITNPYHNFSSIWLRKSVK
ncbi:MAG: hypothetical protein RL065_927 [Bacteroidota bacterium]|jgi:hypothetical protein